MENDMSHGNYVSPSLAHRGAIRKRLKVARIFNRWLGGVARKWERQRTIAALEALNDRLLLDIGIRRSEIRQVVDSLTDRELRKEPLARSTSIVETNDAFYREAA
jgi:uncharacterized protein YjiS (DUF1127 family)